MNAGQEQGNIFGYSARAAKGQFGQQWDESQARFVGLRPQLNRNCRRDLAGGGPAGIDGLQKRGLGTLGEGAFPFLMRSRLRQFLPEAGPYLAQKEA